MESIWFDMIKSVLSVENLDTKIMNENGSKWISDKIWVSEWVNEWVGEWVIKFNGLSGDNRQLGPYSPYKPSNYSLYIGIFIFPHIDNPQSMWRKMWFAVTIKYLWTMETRPWDAHWVVWASYQKMVHMFKQ